MKVSKTLLLFLFWLVFFIGFQPMTIYGGDSGDLVSAAFLGGIPHPPGYPLYTFIAGFLVKIPFNTIAFRVGLLSSFSSALCLTVLYGIVKRLTKNWLVSLIAVGVLGFNYTFWLYSIVPEVFALNNLLAVLLIYFCLGLDPKNKNKKKIKYSLMGIVFITGLMIVHHHTLLFLYPGLFFLLRRMKLKLSSVFSKKDVLLVLLLFLISLLPLVYLPIVSRSLPAIDWGFVYNWENFLRLLSRADYGSFVSSGGYGKEPVFRLFSVLAFAKYFLEDFWVLGVFLFFLGFYYLFLKKRDIFWFFLIDFLSLIFFLFYASYKMGSDFSVATFERFMLLPYVLMTIVLGCGLFFFCRLIKKIFKKNLFFRRLIYFGLVIYPLAIFVSNYPKLVILKDDYTAENFAKNVLDSLPENSLLILSTDTYSFDTTYYYYTNSYRQDVKLIQLFKLFKEEYFITLGKYYPELTLKQVSKEEALMSFLQENSKFPAFFSVDAFLPPGQYIPYGLLMKYYPESEATPSAQEVMEINQKMWESYQDPLSGSLKSFKNLFLADILRIYSTAHEKTGLFLMREGYWDEAKQHFEEMEKLDSKDLRAYDLLVRISLLKGECQQAEDNFKKVLEIEPNDVYALAFLRKTYLECYQDQEKAKEFEDACLQQEIKEQTKLEDI